MNQSSISLIKSIKRDIHDVQEIRRILNVKEWQFNNLVSDLIKHDYVEKYDSGLYFKQNPKTILLRDVAEKYDIEKLLRDSNEYLFSTLVEGQTLEDLQRLTQLSQSTIYRSLGELESIGAIIRRDNKIYINKSEESLYLFAKLLSTENEAVNLTERSAQIIYQDPTISLKRVPAGSKSIEGQLTAFSIFSDYGIEYHTANDYYVEQESELTLEDVLIHAIIIASKNRDKNGITMAILFYLKNKNKMDLLTIRSSARRFAVSNIWIGIEGYLRNIDVKNIELFPTRNEFEEKAQLYEINSELYTLPVAYPRLFEELANNLDTDVTAYLLGGENMRIKGLKDRTKDCDIVTSDDTSSNHIAAAFEKMGYQSIDKKIALKDDLRVEPSIIMVHDGRSNIDIFTKTIARKLYLSDTMMKRSKIEEFTNHHKLRLGILQNEDVFLLKAVTDREGDIHDMSKIVQAGRFDWNIVWTELEKQEKDTGNSFSILFLDNIDDLIEQTGIHPPFYKKLLIKATDEQICKTIRSEGMFMDELVPLLTHNDISEQTVRNRIDSLQRTRLLKKIQQPNGRVYLKATKANVLRYTDSKNLLDQKYYFDYENLTQYIKRLSSGLLLPVKTEYMALQIAEKVSNSPAFIGNRSRNLAAAIVYAVTRVYGPKRSRKSIAEIGGVSEPRLTILSQKVVRELKK